METVQEKNRFTQLLDAVKTGWEIEEPVLLGKMWRSTGEGGVYHFVLRNRREDKTTLLSLSPTPSVLVFLSENKLKVSVI